MTTFQLIALLFTVAWLCLVVIRFRRSTIVLIVGLFILGLGTLVALLLGWVTLGELGLGRFGWLPALGFALAGLVVMVAWSPLADRLAARWFPKPPTLDAFAPIRQSRLKLVAGILAAWVLGGILEELVARGIVLQSIRAWLAPGLPLPLAAGIAILVAGMGAGAMHFYQGPRAVLIITQLSILFGILFVVSGYNLWAVMICHGLYDTIAFIRFAGRKKRRSPRR